MSADSVVWTPSPAYTAGSAIQHFMTQHGITDYPELLRRSQDVAWYWDAFIRFSGLEFYRPYHEVVDLSRGLPFPRWFVGGHINLAHNALDRWAANPASAGRIALIWEGEDGTVHRFSYAQLEGEACQVAQALQAAGVARGDRVALYMPLIPETVTSIFGIYKLGAIAVPLFSGFGPDALALRLQQVEARAVITADGFFRGGKFHPLKAVLDRALANAPTVQTVIVAERADACPLTPGRDHRWSELVGSRSGTFATVQTDSEECCMVAYSSGTSGRPKGIVHVHGGVAAKSAEIGLFVYDFRPGDIVYQITDFGWMMGQAPLLRAYSAGAALLLYEGSPAYPSPNRIFRLIEKHGITVFGAPATALRQLKSTFPDPSAAADLTSLRLLSHTGEPIDSDTWMWYFRWGQERLPILNVSGGTEVFAGLLTSTFMQPLKPTCLGALPAVGAVVVDETGQPVPPGAQGYLGFTLPQPSQTRGFWREPDARYLETYFPLGPHLWWHGDVVEVDQDGFWFHRGRADDVIKVAGRRTGPGEIEEVINQMPEVLESAAIGVPHPIKGEAIIALVVPRPGAAPLAAAVRAFIVARLGKPYEPERVYIVRDLPKTRTAKIVRRLIRHHYLNEPLGDTSSLVNPDVLSLLPTAQALPDG